MTPRSSGPGGEYAPLRGTTNLRLTANQHCKCNGKLRWRSCGHHFPSQPGRGSATDCLGHSRKADLVNFSQAPKLTAVAGLSWAPIGAFLLATSLVPNWLLGLVGVIAVCASVILLAATHRR